MRTDVKKEISVIIVTWNVSDFITQCVESAQNSIAGIPSEIVIIDNNSTDGTKKIIKELSEKYTNIIYRINADNMGFAQANNAGIKIASGKYIVLLNPDTIVKNNAFKEMLRFFSKTPNVAVAGCRHLNSDGTLQPSVRAFPTLLSQSLILLKLHRIFPNLPSLKKYFLTNFDYEKTQIVDQVAGSFFMLPRQVIDDIGYLDEKYFIWFEEVDYCKRVKEKGKFVYYVSQAEIIHFGSQSFQQVLSTKKQRMFNASMRYFFLKHHGITSYLIISCLHPTSMLLSFFSRITPKNRQNNI